MFLRFRRNKRFASLKKIFNDPTIHLELCRNAQASMKYCMKEESRVDGPWEFGNKPGGSGGDHKSLKIKDIKNLTQEELEDLSCFQYNQVQKALQIIKLNE